MHDSHLTALYPKYKIYENISLLMMLQPPPAYEPVDVQLPESLTTCLLHIKSFLRESSLVPPTELRAVLSSWQVLHNYVQFLKPTPCSTHQCSSPSLAVKFWQPHTQSSNFGTSLPESFQAVNFILFLVGVLGTWPDSDLWKYTKGIN